MEEVDKESIWSVNGGVYFGYKDKEVVQYTGDRHLFSFGPNGSGKSRRMLLPNLAPHPSRGMGLPDWSILVVDPKGDLHAMTAEARRRAGSRIVTLHPFGKRSDGFNPIACLDPDSDDFADDAMWLAEAIIRIEGKEPHWSQAAQELVAAIIMYVRLILGVKGTFADVRAMLGQDHNGIRNMVQGSSFTDPKQYELFLGDKTGYVKANPKYSPPFEYAGKLYSGMIITGERYKWPEIGHKARRFGDITPENREILSVISTALTQTRWLDSRAIKRDLAGPAFDFSIMKEQPVTVYLILPARRLATHSTWLRLMIGSILQVLMKDTRRSKVPVLFMLDEFFAAAEGDGLPVITRNMAMLRGYGIKLWTVLQDLGQAKRLYGDDGFQSFISNTGVLQSFAPQDVITAELLSQLAGQTTLDIVSASTSTTYEPGFPSGNVVSDSTSATQAPAPYVLPQKFRGMDEGVAVLFSHKMKGPALTYFPYPTEWRHLQDICALDPAG